MSCDIFVVFFWKGEEQAVVGGKPCASHSTKQEEGGLGPIEKGPSNVLEEITNIFFFGYCNALVSISQCNRRTISNKLLLIIIIRPRLFENLFLSNRNLCDVTPERVSSSLNFPTTESSATRDHILQYINECSKQGMIYFCNSVLRTQKIVSFSVVVYYMYCT